MRSSLGNGILLVRGISTHSSPDSHCTFSHLLLSKGRSAEGEHTNSSLLIQIKPSVLFCCCGVLFVSLFFQGKANKFFAFQSDFGM